MKMLYYLSVLCFLLSANEAHSYFLSHSTNLVAQIKPNPTKGSEPAFNPVKIAAIYFIENDGGPRFGINFGCDKGYALIEGKCKPNACEGYPYEDAISVANCENFEKCLSGSGYKYKCTSCKNGRSLSGGKCVCEAGNYPYNETDNPCFYAYDTGKQCSEIGVDGKKKIYYVGCKCPDKWQKCDGKNQKGLGTACESYGEKSYYNCGCQDAYNKTCSDSRPADSGDYCLNLSDATRYYDECYSCDITRGEIYNYDDYWCSHEWVVFPVIGNLFGE